mmetsp:Transcript_23278/g.51708  ORF Transcript_23278/g.51708 Transcript_23278/m.51708 type:complete len:126 (+) Transcript_23278:722-1099(+)
MPETKTLYFGTDPPGLRLILDGFDTKTPEKAGEPLAVVTWINHRFTIDVRDQGNMVFESWSDGSQERYSKDVVHGDHDVGSTTSDWAPRANVKTARFVRFEEEDESGRSDEKGSLMLSYVFDKGT